MNEIVCPDCGVPMLSIVAIICNDGKRRCIRCGLAQAQTQAQTWTCGLCKARFASETAMQSHVCEAPSFQLHHENLQLRARVKELERSIKLVVRQDETEAANVALAKDLARKRDECERLESLIGDVRRQNFRISAERDDARAALASSATELAKLRRELRGKR